jgi:hypothetical protein
MAWRLGARRKLWKKYEFSKWNLPGSPSLTGHTGLFVLSRGHFMDLIHDEIVEAANRRGAAKKATYPTVVAACYDSRSGRIVITFDTGVDLAFAPHHGQGLEKAGLDDLDVVGSRDY